MPTSWLESFHSRLRCDQDLRCDDGLAVGFSLVVSGPSLSGLRIVVWRFMPAGVVRGRRRRWQVPIADGMRMRASILLSCTANGAAMGRLRRWRRCRTRHGLLSRSRCDCQALIELSAAGVFFFVALMRFNSAPGGLVASIAGSGQNLGMLTDASKCSTKKKPSTSHLDFEDCSKNARTRSEAHAARKELESAKQWDSRPGPASPPSSHGAMPRQHVESMLGLQSFIATTVTAARCSQRLCMSHVSSHLSISNSTSYPAPPHRT